MQYYDKCNYLLVASCDYCKVHTVPKSLSSFNSFVRAVLDDAYHSNMIQ